MDERNDYNSIPMKTTSLQNLINKFEEIKDLDYMVQVMILRGEAEKLLQQEREQIFLLPMYDVSGSVICPNDIRIGNLVTDEFYESFKTIIKVDSVDSRGINLGIEDDGNYPECASRWIEPYYRFDTLRAIPISEELLFKIGAVKLDFKESPIFNLKGLQINFINGLWIEYVSRVEIKGLHFLQNIFYFRNSEELSVSVLTDR